jgi:hypothetical protein
MTSPFWIATTRRAQEVAVQRVRQPSVGDGRPRRVQGLRRDLPAVQRPRPLHQHAGPVQVLLDALKVEQVEDGRLAQRGRLAE